MLAIESLKASFVVGFFQQRPHIMVFSSQEVDLLKPKGVDKDQTQTTMSKTVPIKIENGMWGPLRTCCRYGSRASFAPHHGRLIP